MDESALDKRGCGKHDSMNDSDEFTFHPAKAELKKKNTHLLNETSSVRILISYHHGVNNNSNNRKHKHTQVNVI